MSLRWLNLSSFWLTAIAISPKIVSGLIVATVIYSPLEAKYLM